MKSKLQKTLDKLGARIREEHGQAESENSQAIKDLANQVSVQFGGVFSKRLVDSTKEY